MRVHYYMHTIPSNVPVSVISLLLLLGSSTTGDKVNVGQPNRWSVYESLATSPQTGQVSLTGSRKNFFMVLTLAQNKK